MSNRHNLRLEIGKNQQNREVWAVLIVTFFGGRRVQITFLDLFHIRNHVWFGTDQLEAMKKKLFM